MIWTKKRIQRVFEIIKSLIPDYEKKNDADPIRAEIDGKRSVILATNKRLYFCKLGLLWSKDFDNISWSKFRHLKIKEGLASSKIELEYRLGSRTLRLEGLNKEQFRSLFRKAQERITVNNEKLQLSSKICHRCGEVANATARVCPHCTHEFSRAYDPA